LGSYGATQGPTVGCFTSDKSFTNFSVTPNGTGGTTVQSLTTDDLTGSSTYVSAGTPWTVTAKYTPATASDWENSVEGSPSYLSGIINELVNSSGAYITPGAGAGQNNQYPTVTDGTTFYISTVSLGSLVGETGTGYPDNTILDLERFCIGAADCTGFGAGGNSVQLEAYIQGSGSTTVTYNCIAGSDAGIVASSCPSSSSSTPITVAFSSPYSVTTLNVTDEYSLDNYTGTETMTSFTNVFGEDEAPEPSMLMPLGTALAGLAILRFSKRGA
jgi:hypothetical protein